MSARRERRAVIFTDPQHDSGRVSPWTLCRWQICRGVADVSVRWTHGSIQSCFIQHRRPISLLDLRFQPRLRWMQFENRQPVKSHAVDRAVETVERRIR